MNKSKYLKKLYRKLYFFDKNERQSIVDYYAEIIDDLMESGKTEESAVSELEPPEVIASNYRKQRKTEWTESGKKIPALFWIVLIAGSPILIGLLGAAIGIVVGISCAVLGVTVGFTVGGFATAVYGLITMFTDFAFGLSTFGTGLFLCGLGLLVTIGIISLSKKIIAKIKHSKEINK